MKSWSRGVGLVVLAIVTGVSCGDDDGPVNGRGGAGGTGGTGGTSGSGGTGGEGGTAGSGSDGGVTMVDCVTVRDDEKITFTGTAPPMYTCDANKSTTHPDGPNSCRNASDCAIINTGKVRDLVRNCGLGCRSPGISCADLATCNSNCVKMATANMIMQPGLTEACGTCYTNIALCSLAFCLSECVADADAIPCVQCQFASGCRVPFEKCSGVDRQP
jgi:hypothetical protein